MKNMQMTSNKNCGRQDGRLQNQQKNAATTNLYVRTPWSTKTTVKSGKKKEINKISEYFMALISNLLIL